MINERLPAAARLAGAAILLTLTGSAFADIYRCTGEDGVPLFTNIPNDPRCQVVVRTGPDREEATAPVSRIVEDNAVARIPAAVRHKFDKHIEAAARHHDVDPALIHAVIAAESGYNPRARSPKGAKGLMQLIPETGARYGAKNLLDPRQNIEAGTRYLKDLITLFGNDIKLALAAYNAGEGAVLRYGKIPPYAETQSYVPKVLTYYRRYREARKAAEARLRSSLVRS
ncbi:MAG: transglycosylase SLT domain-containing protein [Betaproteobacteria bacterium]|nr:transglycosylase SLT domain-containing protein [Betaproteobacteria bacterium]